MASSKKRPHLALETPDNTGSSSSSDSDQSDNEEEASNDELQVVTRITFVFSSGYNFGFFVVSGRIRGQVRLKGLFLHRLWLYK